MIHELKTQIPIFERVGRGEMKAIITKHDVDYQSGDTLRLLRVDGPYDYRTRHYVDRDEKGRFVRGSVEDDPLDVVITHVLPAAQTGGKVHAAHVMLSVHRP